MKPMYLKRILSITIGIINNQQVIFVSYLKRKQYDLSNSHPCHGYSLPHCAPYGGLFIGSTCINQQKRFF